MKSPIAYRAFVFVILLTATGCHEAFSPKGPFQQRLVAYSVLSTQTDTQYVRLDLSFNPDGFDPNTVTDKVVDTTAQVVVTAGNQTFSFHDTLLTSDRQAPLPSPVHAFVNSSFRPQPGTSYVLTVVSTHGTISASTTMPATGTLAVRDQSKLLYPGSFPNQNIEVDGILGRTAKGFLVRFIVEFSPESDTSIRAEQPIPLSYDQGSSGSPVPVFPQLQRATSFQFAESYPVANFIQTLAEITSQYKSKIILRRAKFYLVQTDESLYDYYNIVNGFEDKYSIRTDQPDYTNIQKGLGVFGSFSVDSLIIHF
jgi:hypothetical protein